MAIWTQGNDVFFHIKTVSKAPLVAERNYVMCLNIVFVFLDRRIYEGHPQWRKHRCA
jgi:hypothetical protein